MNVSTFLVPEGLGKAARAMTGAILPHTDPPAEILGEKLSFLNQHLMVVFAMLLMVLLMVFFYHTRAGLVLRSVGESPESAHDRSL